MKVHDIMTHDVEAVRPDATVQDAALKMKTLDIGPLPISDGDWLLGMVTDRDITIRSTAEGQDPKQTPVRDIMTPQVVYCYEDQDIQEAAELMQQKQIRRLIVLDRHNKLVGMISLGDIAAKLRDEQISGPTLAQISKPCEPMRLPAL